MPRKRVWNLISIFETSLTAAEWSWRIGTLLVIGGTGTVTGLIAKTDPILKGLGLIYWVAVGIITALIAAIILFLVKSSQLKQAQADLNRTMALPKSTINPLSDSFTDSIIPVEDLRLPTIQLHENKHLKRCKLVGPAAIAILGGSYVHTGFKDCGDIVALPANVYLTGIVVLKNCTVEDCEFIRTTIFVDQNSAKAFANVPGARVKGIGT